MGVKGEHVDFGGVVEELGVFDAVGEAVEMDVAEGPGEEVEVEAVAAPGEAAVGRWGEVAGGGTVDGATVEAEPFADGGEGLAGAGVDSPRPVGPTLSRRLPPLATVSIRRRTRSSGDFQ